eukprot:jgi/Mesvir1/4184/Mv08896-RA.2
MACSLSDWLAGPGAATLPGSKGTPADGDELAAALQARERGVRKLLAAVATALAYLHQAGIVHGAVTPDNILLPRAGELASAKLGNFSAARRWARGDEARARSEESLFIGCRDDLFKLYSNATVPPHGSVAAAGHPSRPGHRRSATSEHPLGHQLWDASRVDGPHGTVQYVAPERREVHSACIAGQTPARTSSPPTAGPLLGTLAEIAPAAPSGSATHPPAAARMPLGALSFPPEDGPPELLCAADIWSLGVVAYTALSGSLPFAASDTAHVWQNMREGRLRFDGPLWPHVSPAACQLISRMLALDPRRRVTAAQVLASPWVAALEGTAEVGDADTTGALVRALSDVSSNTAGGVPLDVRRGMEREKSNNCRAHGWEHKLAASRLATKSTVQELPSHMRRVASDCASAGLGRKPLDARKVADAAAHGEELRRQATLRGAVRTGKQAQAQVQVQAAGVHITAF